jgi:hypothetical protein
MLCVCILAACNAPRPTPNVSILAVPNELLIDTSLEGPYHSQGTTAEINVSTVWRAWYVDDPGCRPGDDGCYIPVCPANCLQDTKPRCVADRGCWWARPEFNPIDIGKASYRVHSGRLAQMYFVYGRMGQGGIYQQVTGIVPGTWLKFTAWMMTWQCYDYGDACEWGRKSDQPYNMHTKVGIDPTGGIDPFSPDTVWSSEVAAYDKWTQFSVIAQAQSDRVTVFTHARSEFDYARKNNDVYVDDLSLVAIAPMTNTVYLPLVGRDVISFSFPTSEPVTR